MFRVTFAVTVVGVLATLTNPVEARDKRSRPTEYRVGGGVVTLPTAGLKTRLRSVRSVEFSSPPGGIGSTAVGAETAGSAEKVIQFETASWDCRDALVTMTVASLPAPLETVPVHVLRDGARKGLIGPPGQGVSVLIEETKTVTVPGGQAECLAIHLSAGSRRIRARIVAHAGRVYQLTAVGKKDEVEHAEVTAALESFAIR